MRRSQITLNIIHEFATPHNNSLVSALRKRSDIRIVTWYAKRTVGILPWKEGLASGQDNYYYDNFPNLLRLLCRILFFSREHFLIIGYSELGTRFALVAFWLFRKHFIYWTDNPDSDPIGIHRSILRRFAYHIITKRASTIFVVGQKTLESFKQQGFPAERLANLPIFIELPEPIDRNSLEAQSLRRKYGVLDDQILFVAASRLVKAKGYDLLIEAVSKIDKAFLQLFKILIFGAGPEEERLKGLVKKYSLAEGISFQGFLEPSDYIKAIAIGDGFIHPARFDAFGGGTLFAMALGVPVIGADGAGTVVERVVSGENGLTYQSEDTDALAKCIVRLAGNETERRSMGENARITAEQWPPSRGARIVCEAVYKEISTMDGSFPFSRSDIGR